MERKWLEDIDRCTTGKPGIRIRVMVPTDNIPVRIRSYEKTGVWFGPVWLPPKAEAPDKMFIAVVSTIHQKVEGLPMGPGGIIMSSPFGIYIDTHTGSQIWNPIDHFDELDSITQDWLAQHPEWPPLPFLPGQGSRK